MTTSQLDFTRPLTPGGSLEFVSSRPTQDLNGDVLATAAVSIAVLSADVIYSAVLSVSSPATLFVGDVEYDINVFRGASSVTDDAWRLRAAAVNADTQSDWDRSVSSRAEQSSQWQQGLTASHIVTSSLEGMGRSASDAAICYQHGLVLAESSASSFSIPARARDEFSVIYEQGEITGIALFCGYLYPPQLHQRHDEQWQVAEQIRHDLQPAKWGMAATLIIESQILFELGRKPSPGRTDLPEPPITPEIVISALLAFSRSYVVGAGLEFYWSKPAKQVIPTREVYFVINCIEFYRASTGQEVALTSVSVTLDTDSMAWQLTASVPRISDARMLNGEQVTLSINGYNWQFVIDSWSENRSYNQRGATITGRSLSAVLSSSLSLKRSYTEQSARTLIQLAERELPDGWSLDWLASDWLVDPSVWSYSNLSPIEAIQTLASAAGAFIYPSLNSRSLAIKPLFNALPWTLGNASPDIYIPDSIITTLGSQYQRRQAADGVWLTGGSAGISALVKRTGTAGSNQLPDVTNSLITTPDAARALGSSLLAQSMPFSSDTLQMPISVDTGLVAPGLVVETTSGIGYSRGLKVSASTNTSRAISVTQTVEIDRYEVA